MSLHRSVGKKTIQERCTLESQTKCIRGVTHKSRFDYVPVSIVTSARAVIKSNTATCSDVEVPPVPAHITILCTHSLLTHFNTLENTQTTGFVKHHASKAELRPRGIPAVSRKQHRLCPSLSKSLSRRMRTGIDNPPRRHHYRKHLLLLLVALGAGRRGEGFFLPLLPSSSKSFSRALQPYHQHYQRTPSHSTAPSTPPPALPHHAPLPLHASTFGFESLLRIPKEPRPPLPPFYSSSTPSISEQHEDPEAAALAAADAEKVVDRLERGLNKLFMIHGWCVSPADAAFLDQAREELQPLLTYLPAREDQAKVETALQVAYHAHFGQVRRSGEPFVRHPIEVAKILCELGMDADSVAAGLLHDTVEDTPVSVADVQAVFGATVRRLVEGETKVSKLPKRLSRNADSAVAAAVRSGTEGAEAALAPPMTDDQLANLLHLLMAMAQDFRVLVVKLADRLHNMRTLGFMSPAKQMKIARETLVCCFCPIFFGLIRLLW